MSATDPNMGWMNPAQPAQPAPAQPAMPQYPQPAPQPVQPAYEQKWFPNPQTGQQELFELNTQINQWVPVQAQPAPMPIPAPAAPAAPQFPQQAPPVAPQPGFPAQQAQPGFPAQPPMPQPQAPMPQAPMPGQAVSISEQMQIEQMRQANASRSAGAGIGGVDAPSLKMSLKGVAAGNFNLVPVDLVYESKITKAEIKLVDAKTHHMIVFGMTIVFPVEYRGTMLRNNINLTEESLGFYRAALEATDLFNYETEEPTLNSEQEFVNKIVRHAVSHREWKGEPRNNVNGAFSKAFESDEAKIQNGVAIQPGMPQMPQQPVPAQPFAQPAQTPHVFAPQPNPFPAAPPIAPQFAPPTGYAAPDPNSNTPQPPTAPNFGQQ